MCDPASGLSMHRGAPRTRARTANTAHTPTDLIVQAGLAEAVSCLCRRCATVGPGTVQMTMHVSSSNML
jgi:hypothetical protein